jgi:hypothetical protein
VDTSDFDLIGSFSLPLVRAATNGHAEGRGWSPPASYAWSGNGATQSAGFVRRHLGLAARVPARNVVSPLRRSMAGWSDQRPRWRRGQRADRWRGQLGADHGWARKVALCHMALRASCSAAEATWGISPLACILLFDLESAAALSGSALTCPGPAAGVQDRV